MLRLSSLKTRSSVAGLAHPFQTKPLSNVAWAPAVAQDEASYAPDGVFSTGLRHHHICNTAFPIGHSSTIKPYRVPRHRDQRAIQETLLKAYGPHLDQMMMYAHVPFCHQRCQFCEYTVVDPREGKKDSVQDTYFDALLKEFDMYADLLNFKEKQLVGFDIGGGTPSMASIDNIWRLFDKVTQGFGSLDIGEMSIETTPKIAAAEPEKMKAYKRMGLQRISFGLQTTDFGLSKKLGRDDANGDYVHRAVENIRNAGFTSFNIDLMYGFPLRITKNGVVDKWPQTVRDCLALEPEHVTLYRMRYKGTKMTHCQSRVGLEQVNQQELAARQILNEAGYHGLIGKNTYSNVKDNSGCSDYLHKRVVEGVPYIGIGLGAQSFSHNSLHYNLGAVTKKMSQYLKSVELNRIPIQDLYHLSQRVAMGKFLSVSFYFGGIDLQVFESIFNARLEDVFRTEVDFVVQKQLMVYDGHRLQMTKEGKQCFAGVVALFYTPAIQKYLEELQHDAVLTEDFDDLWADDAVVDIM